MDTLKEQRKSNKNKNSEIVEARVIANFGDSGLTEDYDFDILSTFIVVMIESVDRVPIYNTQGADLFAIVARPSNLWITAGINTNNPTTQTRTDAYGNVNIGQASNFSQSNIPQINKPYQLGEKIKIRKLSQPYNFPNPSNFFTSKVPGVANNILSYGTVYSNSNPANNLSYIKNTPNAQYALNLKPLVSATNYPVGTYGFFIGKFHYEGFLLNYNSTYNPQNVVGITSIFAGNGINGNTSIYNYNGGYLFWRNNYTTNFLSINYEDINADGKDRIPTNDCNPLIVCTPSQFPIAANRSPGLISYNPSYSPIGIGS